MTAAGEGDGRVCANPTCDALLTRRPKEKPHRFRLRVYCSIPCSNMARVETRRQEVEEKPCAGCDSMCRRRPDEPASCWASRRYCTAICARRARIVPPAPKVCPVCETTFTRRVGQETAYHFSQRLTCSKACSNRRVGQSRTVDPGRVKTCPHCDTEFGRRIGAETVAEFEHRIHCSRACHLAARRPAAADSAKTCERCGGTYRRPASVGPKQWAARRFCGLSCSTGAKQAGAAARRATPRPTRKPRPAPAPVTTPQTVWRPAAWGGPIVVAPPAPPVEVLDAAV